MHTQLYTLLEKYDIILSNLTSIQNIQLYNAFISLTESVKKTSDDGNCLAVVYLLIYKRHSILLTDLTTQFFFKK